MDIWSGIVLLMFDVCLVYSQALTRGMCPIGFLQCHDGENWRSTVNSTCIQETKLCDKEPDCSDGSDEQYCFSSNQQFVVFTYKFIRGPCALTDILCRKGKHKHDRGFIDIGNRCIKSNWICDSDQDCLDGSDELYCPYNQERGFQFSYKIGNCSDGYYMCPTSWPISINGSRCIEKSQICDGSKHCVDGSDEKYCPYISLVRPTSDNMQSVPESNSPGFSNELSTESSGKGESKEEDYSTRITPSPISTTFKNEDNLASSPCSQTVSSIVLFTVLLNTVLLVLMIIIYLYRFKYNSHNYPKFTSEVSVMCKDNSVDIDF